MTWLLSFYEWFVDSVFLLVCRVLLGCSEWYVTFIMALYVVDKVF